MENRIGNLDLNRKFGIAMYPVLERCSTLVPYISCHVEYYQNEQK